MMIVNAAEMEKLINKLVKNNMEDPDFPVDFFKLLDVDITYDDMSDKYKISKDDFIELDIGTLRSLFGQTTRKLEGTQSLLEELQMQKEKLEEEREILSAQQEAIFRKYFLLMKEQNPEEEYCENDLLRALHIESEEN
jgi:hypothetical protein